MPDAATWFDLFGSLRAVGALTALLLVPGYLFAHLTDILGFCSRPLKQRLPWSIALSFGLVPIFAVEAAKFGSLRLVCCLSALASAAFVWLIAPDLRGGMAATLRRPERIALAVAVAWCLFAILEISPIGVGNRLYLSVTVYDHAQRTAFVDSILRTGVPPANPLYWSGHPTPMRYYYFWFVLTAAAAKLAHSTAEQAMIASIVWSGFGLAAILDLYCRHFLEPRPAPSQDHRANGTRPRTLIALSLLAVAGLDIIAVLIKALFRLPTDPDMDWWSTEQVTTWVAALLWVPHHIGGLVCCLFGFLLVWLSCTSRRPERGLLAIVAGLSFASALGLSTWIALAFAMVLAAWATWILFCEPASRRRIPVLFGAAMIGIVSAAPYIWEMLAHSPVPAVALPGPPPARASMHLLGFNIRHIIEADFIQIFPFFSLLARSHPHFEDVLASLLLLVPGYVAELGFYVCVLAVGVRPALRWSSLKDTTESTRTAIVFTVAGLCFSTFLRSTVIGSNDFGFRAILIPQFFLLLLAVLWLEGVLEIPPPRRGGLARTMLWLGVAGTVYQVIGLRLYLPVEETLHRPRAAALGEYSLALRKASVDARGKLPSNAVVQYATQHPSIFYNLAEIEEIPRQAATAFPECDSAFGGDQSRCQAVEQGATTLFAVAGNPSAPTGAPAREARAICAQLGIDNLIATRWDGVWYDRSDWVWSLQPVIDTGSVRILQCGNANNSGKLDSAPAN